MVRPSLIRVEADEVTYNLHILLRYELETALLAGDLPVAELSAGQLRPLRDWLAATVYGWGCQLGTEEIIRRATGRGLDAAALMRRLESLASDGGPADR